MPLATMLNREIEAHLFGSRHIGECRDALLVDDHQRADFSGLHMALPLADRGQAGGDVLAEHVLHRVSRSLVGDIVDLGAGRLERLDDQLVVNGADLVAGDTDLARRFLGRRYKVLERLVLAVGMDRDGVEEPPP
jgi:hypothetical protein